MSTLMMQENYNALMALPLVQKLMKQNKQLRKENRSLRNLICSLPEFRCSHLPVQVPVQAPVQVSEEPCRTVRLDRPVLIKSEPDNVVPMEIYDNDDDVVFVASEQAQNIIYTLEDDIMDVVEEASEAEEEAEEAEEEEDEASEAEEEEEEDEEEEEEEYVKKSKKQKAKPQPKSKAKTTDKKSKKVENVFISVTEQQENFLDCTSELSEEEYV